jgi:hypothetical protein
MLHSKLLNWLDEEGTSKYKRGLWSHTSTVEGLAKFQMDRNLEKEIPSTKWMEKTEHQTKFMFSN